MTTSTHNTPLKILLFLDLFGFSFCSVKVCHCSQKAFCNKSRYKWRRYTLPWLENNGRTITGKYFPLFLMKISRVQMLLEVNIATRYYMFHCGQAWSWSQVPDMDKIITFCGSLKCWEYRKLILAGRRVRHNKFRKHKRFANFSSYPSFKSQNSDKGLKHTRKKSS